MKRDYDTGEANDIIFFTGVEVEKTPAFGMKTLFVTGIQTFNEIMKFYYREGCEHIFFGANHSYQACNIRRVRRLGSNDPCVYRSRYTM